MKPNLPNWDKAQVGNQESSDSIIQSLRDLLKKTLPIYLDPDHGLPVVVNLMKGKSKKAQEGRY